MILVTGATGFVGRSVVQMLSEAGRRVRVLSRHPPSPGLPAEKVLWHTGDVSDVAALERALVDVAAVVHLAAVLDGTEERLWDVNVHATRHLSHAARCTGVPSFIHVSSAGVYGDGVGRVLHRETDAVNPYTAYERSKLASEAVVRDTLAGSRTHWIILRPTGVYGGARAATQAFLREVARRRIWLHAPPQLLMNPVYVCDLAAAIRLALDHPECSWETFNVAGDRVLSYSDWILENARSLGVRSVQLLAPARSSAWLARTAVGVMKFAHLSIPPRLQRAMDPVRSRAVDLSRIGERLGYRPTPLEHSLQQTVAEARALSVPTA
jgi:nucleoside-diphosphate-sugar epimerase